MNTYKRTEEQERAEKNKEWITPSLAKEGQLSLSRRDELSITSLHHLGREKLNDEIRTQAELDMYIKAGSADDVRMTELKKEVVRSLGDYNPANSFTRFRSIVNALKKTEKDIKLALRELEYNGVAETEGGGSWRLTGPVRRFLKTDKPPKPTQHLHH